MQKYIVKFLIIFFFSSSAQALESVAKEAYLVDFQQARFYWIKTHKTKHFHQV